jgi:hypothetical protein
MKIRIVGAVLFHADRRTDMTKLVVTFPDFENAPKNCKQPTPHPERERERERERGERKRHVLHT